MNYLDDLSHCKRPYILKIHAYTYLQSVGNKKRTPSDFFWRFCPLA